MRLEAHIRSWVRFLKRHLRHRRRLRDLDRRIEAREDAVRALEGLIEGGRRRLEDAASGEAFRRLLERDVISVHGIGPTLADRIASHPLMEDPAAFRASVQRVSGVGPERKARLLEWERRTRERRRELRDRLIRKGGVDAELEAELARLREELKGERAALREARSRRRSAAEGGAAAERARVVLDTNVFVAAGFHPRSASASLVRWVREGRLGMPWTDATREEVERILRRIPPLSWSAVRGLFREEDRLGEHLPEDGLGWIPDPDDRKFAAVARSAGAVLVSNDSDVLEDRSRAGFPILTSGEYREDRGG